MLMSLRHSLPSPPMSKNVKRPRRLKFTSSFSELLTSKADFENRRPFGAFLRIINAHQQTRFAVALCRPVTEIVKSFRSDEFGQIVFQSLFIERFIFILII